MKELNGVFVSYKPTGIGSTDVVRLAKRIFKMKKIGHTGTLDPLAEGVLVLCLGRATKAIEYMQEEPKTYIAGMKLGFATDTLDSEGRVTRESNIIVGEEEFKKVLSKFVGEIKQVPPMYSALKYKGRRLYDLAREGIEVKRDKREVTVYESELLNFDFEKQSAIIKVEVSSGTYIRSLINDIGEELESFAFMSSLIRTHCSGYGLDRAIELKKDGDFEYSQHIISMNDILPKIQSIKVSIDLETRLLNGMTVILEDKIEDGLYRVLSCDKVLLGIGRVSQGQKGKVLKLTKHLKVKKYENN